MSRIKWSLLMATVPERREARQRMLNGLEPQLRDDIELIVIEDNQRIDVGIKKQTLLEMSRGEYVSFIDDDDQVAPNFVDRIYPLLDGVDYVGFRAQIVGTWKPSYTTITCPDWSEDNDGWYRNIIHVCPIRREIAIQGTFVGCPDLYQEDKWWTDQIQHLCKTEHQVGYADEDIMYHYYAWGYTPWEEVIAPRVERRRD